MHRNSIIALLVIAVGMPATAYSQDVRTILETSQKKQLERWKGVDVYVVEQSMAGTRSTSTFERTEFKDSAGNSQTLFLPTRDSGIAQGSCSGPRSMSADDLEEFALGYEVAGTVLGAKQDEQLAGAGIPSGMMKGSASEPWASPDPRIMMGAGATFLRAAADAKRQQDAHDPTAEGHEQADHMAQFIEQARLVGTESIDGRKAFHLRATGIDHVQESDGSEFRTEAMSMWVDTAEYVPLRIKMEGTATSDGETRPMNIEMIHADYRDVPGSNMYESHKQIMRIGGMMDAKQQAEMREAQKQMAEIEKQMASMPASQRQMMESMMGPQLEMMRNMSSGGGFQTETITHSITVNPQMTDASGKACENSYAKAKPPQDESERSLISKIQTRLASLGFYEGATDGTMNMKTAMAVTKYEDSRGLKITGKATAELAGIMDAESGGLTMGDLTADYLEGHWCTDVVQEQSLYKFAADGSYRVGTVGLTITQMDGINYFPEVHSHQDFLDDFEYVRSKDKDRFAVIDKGRSELAFTRGNCFEGI